MKLQSKIFLIGLLMLSSLQFIYAQTQKGWDSFLQGDIETAINRFEKKAKKRDANAAYVAGMLYIDNYFDKPNIEQGVKWLKYASERGNGHASFNLFVLNYEHILDEGNATVKGYLEKAAEQNLVQAHLFLAQLYSEPNQLLGNDAPVLTKMAEHAFKAYELEKSPLSYFLMGTIYAFNDKLGFGVKQDTNLGIEYFEKALGGELMLAAAVLYDIYSSGEQIAPDEEKAAMYKEIIDAQFMKFFTESIEIKTPKLLSVYSLLEKDEALSIIDKLKYNSKNGSGFADYQLSQIYGNGIPYVEANSELSMHYLREAATKENVKAMYEVYDRADYMDRSEYIPYLEQAAQLDYIPALLKLAILCRTSNEEGVDSADALGYYIRAANLGSVEAMQELAVFYENGDYYLDLDEDLDEAIKWCSLVIQNQANNINAYRSLTSIYLEKSGSDNIAKAYELASHAHKLDSKDEEVLVMLATIYSSKESEKRDVNKAISIYKDLLANADLDEELKSEYNYLLGLLYIDSELGDKKEYAKALECFTEAIKTKNYSNAYFNIAEIYRLGLGGLSVDIEKAKENYSLAIYYYYNQYFDELAHLNLANILIESEEQKDKEEAVGMYISLEYSYPDKYDFSEIIIEHLEFDSSQKWIYNKYKQTNSPIYLANIERGSEKGILGLQYYKALIDLDVDKNEGVKELTKLADKQYVPALIKLSEWSEGEQEIELKIKIATLTNSDSDIYEVQRAYLYNKNYEESLKWYHKLEDADYSFSKSRAEEANEKLEELKELQEKVKANDVEAMHAMAIALKRGTYGTNNEEEAIRLLQKASDLGFTNSQLYLAQMYEDSEDTAEQQISTQYFMKAANNGSYTAMIELGKRYINGIGVEEDREKAKEYFMKAEQIDPDYLGNFYIRIMRNYDGLIAQIEDDSIEDKSSIWWRIRGYLKEGNAVKKDEKRADYILRQLADNGYSEAQVELGENYATGNGVEQDWDKAANYLRLSNNSEDRMLKIYDNYVVPASKGDNEAKLKLGQVYLDRSAFYNNPAIEKRAYELIEESANNGIGEAQYEMYTFYNSNKLACKSQKETDAKAMEWLNKAIDSSYPKAVVVLAEKYMRNIAHNTSEEEAYLKIEQLYTQAATVDSSYVIDLVNFYLNKKIKIDKAIELLVSVAGEKYPNAFLQLANIYSTGDYDIQNFAKAKGYYEELVNLGRNDYKINIGDLYIEGDKYLARSQEMALKYYTEALEDALSSNKDSRFDIDDISEFYDNIGDGLFYARNNFDKDIELSVLWYTKAAELGRANACNFR